MLIDLLELNKKRASVISAIIDCFNGLFNNENTQTSMCENIDVIAQRTLLKHLDDKERAI
jgi:hypothetical protein